MEIVVDLPAPLGPQEAVDLAPVDVEGDPVHGDDAPRRIELLVQALDVYQTHPVQPPRARSVADRCSVRSGL